MVGVHVVQQVPATGVGQHVLGGQHGVVWQQMLWASLPEVPVGTGQHGTTPGCCGQAIREEPGAAPAALATARTQIAAAEAATRRSGKAIERRITVRCGSETGR